MKKILLAVLLALPPALAAGGTSPPAEYVDKGACPFECCVYRTWTTKVDTVLRAMPDAKAPVAGVAKAGRPVDALTGEVHTRAGRFVVKKPHGQYRPGNVLWVYTFIGEGEFKVWHDGTMQDEDLGFSPWGGSVGSRCEADDELCWGTLEHELQFTWWVKVRTADGREGWSNQPDHFGNQDACGLP